MFLYCISLELHYIGGDFHLTEDYVDFNRQVMLVLLENQKCIKQKECCHANKTAIKCLLNNVYSKQQIVVISLFFCAGID